jgi:hypothetical protein
MKPRLWTIKKLRQEARTARSYRDLLIRLGLKPAGGNYAQILKALKTYKINLPRYKGAGWNRGLRGLGIPRLTMAEILKPHSTYQSFKLKKRLFADGLKRARCENCGWAKQSRDGRIPLELDHRNGDRYDNRLSNLRILCPNCHSLQPTHRGRNINKER